MIITVIRIIYVVSDGIDVSTEEAQYWLWSKNLAWSYYSKPPLIAWMNYLSSLIFSHSEFVVKFNAILIGFIAPFPLYFLSKRIFQQTRTALLSVMLLYTLPFFNYVSIYFTTDSLVFLFWLYTLLFTWKAINDEHLIYWLIAAIFMGLGLLSKYTMVLFYPSLLIFLLIEKKLLKHLKGFILFSVFSALFLLPVVVWNTGHEWVSFKHVFHLTEASQSLSLREMIKNLIEYVGSQFLVLSPFYLILIFATISLFKKERKQKLALMGTRFLIVPVIFIWLFFLLIAVKNIQANWLIFSYGTVPILLANYFRLKFSKDWKTIAITLTVVLQLLTLSPKLLDHLRLSNFYPARFDTLHRFAGWNELGTKISELRKTQLKDKHFIFSDNYHIASELAFYVDGQPKTYCVNFGRRMNQFDMWPGIEQFENKGYDAIFVSNRPAPDNLYAASDEITKHEFIRKYRKFYNKKMFIYVIKDFKNVEQQQNDDY
jgi:4-amino-4-deoxy-L-arabinose transferase-like glycosyltransferase